MKFFEFFIVNRKFTFVMVVFVVLFGLSGVSRIASEEFPNVNLGAVKVTTFYDGASASDIEIKITKPIEEEIRKVTGLKKVKSISQPGLSSITVNIDIDKYDVEKAITDLQRAIDRTSGLPSDLKEKPNVLEIKSDEFPAIELAVMGGNDIRDRNEIAESLKESLEDLKGVSSIIQNGETDRRFNIQLDPEALRDYQIDINQVVNAIQVRNRSVPGGFIEASKSQQLIRLDGKVSSVDELQNTVIRSNFTGRAVKLKDVASIQDEESDASLIASHNGKPATLLIVNKKGGYDIVDLAEQASVIVDDYRKKYENRAEFEIFNNAGLKVTKRVSVLASNALFGLILVIIFLLIFLPGRAGIMTSFSLPIAVLATLGYMNSQGMTLNTVTILALIIALGMLVDNSVVVAENFTRLRKLGLNSKQAVLVSVSKLWLPITVTAMTTIAAFLPMLVTTGIMGQFIQYIPLVVTASLTISLLESFVFLPARLSSSKDDEDQDYEKLQALMKNPELDSEADGSEIKKDWFQKWIQPPFEALVGVLIRFRYISMIGFTALIVGSIVGLLKFNKFNLFPSDQTEIYVGRITTPEGSTLEFTDKVLREISTKLYAEHQDKIEHLVSKSGLDGVGPDDPKEKRGENVGLLMVYVNEYGRNNIKTPEMIEMLAQGGSEVVKEYEGVSASFEAMQNGPPVGAPVTAVFRSGNAEQMASVITTVMDALKNTKGIYDVDVDDVYGEREVLIDVDYQKASRLSIDPNALQATIRTAFAGFPAANINLNDKEVDLFVRLADEARVDQAELEKLLIMNRSGRLVPLKNIVEINQNPSEIFRKRFDFKKARTVTANINEDIMTVPIANKVVEDTFAKISREYPDVTLTFGGAGENTRESMDSLASAGIISIIGIFALLVFMFKSYIRPIIILTTIPLGIVGVSIAFYVQQMPVSFMALIGIVGLGGIIVNSGIVLISFIEDMRQNTNKTLKRILIESSAIRLRAVIVTALTTVSGLMPTAYGIGGGDQFIIPMAMALAWGLVSGTILALLWVPCAYAITEDITEIFNRMLSGAVSAGKSIVKGDTQKIKAQVPSVQDSDKDVELTVEEATDQSNSNKGEDIGSKQRNSQSKDENSKNPKQHTARGLLPDPL